MRRVGSIRSELLSKSREAALAAVQIFNSPTVTFKSETYTVLMIIAWTYLLHAHYRKQHTDYRYSSPLGKRKRYHRTSRGAYKYWELERCLDDAGCPLAKEVVANLRFLVGLRNEIEHQMTTRIDDLLSARFQACCINFDEAIVAMFGKKYGIAQHLSVSLQFASLGQEQVDFLSEREGLPGHIQKFIEGFDGALPPDQYASPKFAYRVIFVPKLANHPNQADQVITFVKPDSELAQTVNANYALIRETERPKWRPSDVVAKIKAEGFTKFGIARHTELWQTLDAKNPAKGLGTLVAKTWYWYDAWIALVRQHCVAKGATYR